MKIRIAWLAILFATRSVVAQVPSDFPFDKEELRELIQEAAVGIEKNLLGVNEQADGLALRVKAMLSRKEPPKATAEFEPRKALVQRMTQHTGACKIGFGVSDIGGFFDVTTGGKIQRYQQLAAKPTSDAAEVWRLLEMRNLASLLEWEDKEKEHREAAAEAGRDWAGRQPQDADAQALLAHALEWGAEKRKVLESALELDANKPWLLAQTLLLAQRAEKALESAVLRKEVPIEAEYSDVIPTLYDQPLSKLERMSLKDSFDEMRQEAELILQQARERGDMPAYLKTLMMLQGLERKTLTVEAATQRDPEESEIAFRARCGLFGASTSYSKLIEERHLRELLKMAGDDSETVGHLLLLVFTMGLLDTAVHMTAGQEPPKLPLELVGRHFARLVAEAESGKDVREAEAVAAVEWAMYLGIQREPYYWEMLPRAIRLDPCRYRNLDLLMAWCAGLRDFAALGALAEMRTVLAPNVQTLRECAASDVRVGDFAAAHRRLDDCLKETPDDVMLLSQKAVAWLREDPAHEGLAKAAAIYDPILPRLPKHLVDLDKAEREILARNVALFLVLSGKDAEAEALLKSILADELLSEEEVKNIRDQLRVPAKI